MPTTSHRGFVLQSKPESPDVWSVQIKNRVLSGHLAAVKKSIDWWCDTASLIDPKEFASLARKKEEKPAEQQESFNGFLLKNDTGSKNGWYCFFNGRLIKGSKEALKKYINANMTARKK
ncbi:DUF3319 domain-containing protein [Vibrio albus]|uniref:DUF3319 domain-containing protein n=1 Tax=Vibrio albus TaxID=2200953 RepID=A0A2U3B674_9VIBR|nr:DUF3319 domain-containing protein [Vibrio albus]PWI32224.1 DUF3319 domain-containing protein [Vibrio albus]